MKLKNIINLSLFVLTYAYSISLYDVYVQAGPANGYDRYIELDSNLFIQEESAQVRNLSIFKGMGL